MTLDLKTCVGAVCFTTERQAKTRERWAQAHGWLAARAWRCSRCGDWHVTCAGVDLPPPHVKVLPEHPRGTGADESDFHLGTRAYECCHAAGCQRKVLTMSECDTVRNAARKIGISHTALQNAIKQGRVREAVVRDGGGRVLGVDPVIAEREWRASRQRMPPTAAALSALEARAPAPGAPVLELHVEGDAPFVAVRLPLGAFERGVAAALREAGRSATPDAIRAVLLAVDVGVWFWTAVGALQAAVDDDLPDEAIPAMWEASGREAVELLGRNAEEAGRGDA